MMPPSDSGCMQFHLIVWNLKSHTTCKQSWDSLISGNQALSVTYFCNSATEYSTGHCEAGEVLHMIIWKKRPSSPKGDHSYLNRPSPNETSKSRDSPCYLPTTLRGWTRLLTCFCVNIIFVHVINYTFSERATLKPIPNVSLNLMHSERAFFTMSQHPDVCHTTMVEVGSTDWTCFNQWFCLISHNE